MLLLLNLPYIPSYPKALALLLLSLLSNPSALLFKGMSIHQYNNITL